MHLLGRAPIHPLLFYSGKIAGYITWLLLILLVLEIDVVDRISFPFSDGIAMALFLVGSGLILVSIINLGGSTRLGLPTEATILKTHGLYKISRNPMYLGINLWTLTSIAYSLNLLIIILGIYSIVIYHRIILGEERFLEDRFGQTYLDYKKIVRRYL